MQEDIKCPQCGGNRFKDLGDNTYKCMYCGSTFTHKETVNEPPTVPSIPPSGQPNIIVNVSGGYEERSQHGSNGNYRPQPSTGGKSKTVAAVLAIFLGGLGIHKFYLKQPGWGIAYIIFCWTYIPAIIGFIEGIMYLCMSDENFDYKYNS